MLAVAGKRNFGNLMGRSIVLAAVSGLFLAAPAALAQTLEPSALTADQLIASGGASSSFCVEFPAGSGMNFVAVSFTGSDTFVSTTPCDPATFVSSLGGTGSGLAGDLGSIEDFLLNGFQNFENVFGAVQAHLDKSVTPEDPGDDVDFPDVSPGDQSQPAKKPETPKLSPEDAKKADELQKEIADLKAELAELEESADRALKGVDEVLDGNTPEHRRIAELEKKLAEFEEDRGANDPEAVQIARNLRDLKTYLEVEVQQLNESYDFDQLEIEDLEDKIHEKQQQLDAIQSGSDSSAFLVPRPGTNGLSSNTALAYQSPGDGHASPILTPLLTQSNTQGFLLDLDALFRRGPSGTSKKSPWNFWLQGSLTVFDDDQAADRDGQFMQFIGGGSYRVNDRYTVGGLVSYNNGNVTSNALSSGLNSNFIGVGLFARANIYDDILLDTVINYQHGWNDITIASASGDFGSDSINIAAGLSKRYYFQPDWWLEPNAGIAYSNIYRSSYTDSSGTAVSGSNVEQGRFTFGPKIGHIFAPVSGPLTQGEVFVGLSGIVDFISNADSSVGNGLVASYPGSGLRVSGGLNMTFDNGWNATASGSYLSVGTLDGYTASINLRIPLN